MRTRGDAIADDVPRGRPLNSRSREGRGAVDLGVAVYGALLAYVCVATGFFTDHSWAWLWLAPLPAVLATALTRPSRRLPEGPVVDLGRTLGHDWVVIGHEVVWIDPATRRSLATAPTSPVTVEEDLSGFRLQIPRTSSPPIEAGWTTQRAQSALSAGFLAVVGVRNAMTQGLTLSTALSLVFASVALSILLGLAMLPYRFLLSRSARDPGPATEVVVQGRVLTANGERFLLSAPGRTISVDAETEAGSVLRLRSDEGSLEIRGRHAEIVWLAEQIVRIPVEEAGGGERVPASLRRLTARE